MRRGLLAGGTAIFVLGAALLVYGFQSAATSVETGQWQVTWYSMRDTFGAWGDAIETATFPSNFNYDPLGLANRPEPIGFKAVMDINVLEDTDVVFTIGGDDGSITLFVDGASTINLYCPDPNTSDTYETTITAGRHVLEIQYYQVLVEDDAAASFSMRSPAQESSTSIMVGGGALAAIGLVLALLGLLLKAKRS
ncbi:MAG: hypothetical protein JTT11_01070 [Candidatus Brockarchaeota archaeon]|nr:hypothetical protein [Candidatus Brockarchaeota archaeon]